MKVFLNAGHKVGLDSGAVNRGAYYGKTEAQTVLDIGLATKGYLETAGVEVEFLQSNSLNGEDEDANNPSICRSANESGADIFVSLHCNAFNTVAKGSEVEVFSHGGEADKLARCILDQIVSSCGTAERYINERPNLAVLRGTSMPAVLVELAFIDNDEDCQKLEENADEFARAVARGITDYECLK